MHQCRAMLLRRACKRAHREGIDPERIKWAAFRVVHEIEPDTIHDRMWLHTGNHTVDRVDIRDLERIVRMRGDLPAGKGGDNGGAELTRGARDQHAPALRHNRWIVLGLSQDVYVRSRQCWSRGMTLRLTKEVTAVPLTRHGTPDHTYGTHRHC